MLLLLFRKQDFLSVLSRVEKKRGNGMSSGYLLFSPFKKFNYKTTFLFPGGKMARIKFRQKMGKETTSNIPLNLRRFREKKREAPFSFHNFHIGIIIAWPPRGRIKESDFFCTSLGFKNRRTHAGLPVIPISVKKGNPIVGGNLCDCLFFPGKLTTVVLLKFHLYSSGLEAVELLLSFFFWGKTGLWKASPRIY